MSVHPEDIVRIPAIRLLVKEKGKRCEERCHSGFFFRKTGCCLNQGGVFLHGLAAHEYLA